jgi:hypothetical protein
VALALRRADLEAELVELQRALAGLQRERDGVLKERDGACRERDRWRRRAEGLAKQVETLKAQLEDARRAAKRQAAPFARRKRKKERKKPGRKPGHAPANRPAAGEADAEVHVPLESCPHCGGPVEEVEDLKPQTVVDIPEKVEPTVTRYHNQSGWCPHCKKRVRSRHRDQTSTANGAAGEQVGPRALSFAADLKHSIGVPFRKVIQVIAYLTGLRICAATVVRAEQRFARRLEPTQGALIEMVRQAQVVHGDETGWYIVGAPRKAWLWVFTSPEPRVTIYAIRLSRGGEVAEEILGEEFAGTLCRDGWAAYDRLACRKGQCHGHLLRRAAELLEVQKAGAARFPLEVKGIIQCAMELKAAAPLLPPPVYRELAQEAHAAMAKILGGRRGTDRGSRQPALRQASPEVRERAVHLPRCAGARSHQQPRRAGDTPRGPGPQDLGWQPQLGGGSCPRGPHLRRPHGPAQWALPDRPLARAPLLSRPCRGPARPRRPPCTLGSRGARRLR